MNLPPPSSDPATVPMEQSHGTTEESCDMEEGEESKTGVKRALSLSPQVAEKSCDPGAESAENSSSGCGPEIKRRNLAMYSEQSDEKQDEV